MPSPPELDERFDGLVTQIRGARPRPPDALRERVAAIAAAPSPLPRASRLSRIVKPALVFAVVLTLAVGLGALVRGAGDRGGADRDAASGAAAGQARERTSAPYGAEDQAAPEGGPAAASGLSGLDDSQMGPPPVSNRLQAYDAYLRVRVSDGDAVGDATTEAMQITRTLGGYVVRSSFGAAETGEGDSLLIVRVPIARVQDAVLRFAELGSVVAQRFEVEDLQRGVDQRRERIAALRTRIASLERELASGTLGDEQRAEARRQLAAAQAQVRLQQRAVDAAQRRGRLARVELTLTTQEGSVAPPKPEGEIAAAARRGLDALGELVAWLLYALIVVGPFAALAAIGVALERRRRQRAGERLLERV